MKYIYIKPIILYAFLIIMSCEPVPEFKFDESIPVVEAFLYQGSSVDDIKVTEVIPFGSSKNDNEVNGLDISISWKGSSFPLINEEKGGGRYYYPGEDLDIISGETYEINFIYDGEEVSSSTTIPYAPTSLNLSSNSSELPQLLDFGILEILDKTRTFGSMSNGIILMAIIII